MSEAIWSPGVVNFSRYRKLLRLRVILQLIETVLATHIMLWRLLSRLGIEKAVNVEPVREGIEPSITGSVRIP